MDSITEAPFGTVLTAIVTPFDADGDVAYGTFWKLCRHLLSSGSDGLVVAGTTGESPTLSDAEKLTLFETAVDAADGEARIIAGTGTSDTRHSVKLTQQAEEIGCDGIMAVTPYYSKPPQAGIAAHFRAIADATVLPVMVYNIPGRTARLLTVETLVEVAEHQNIVAVKDAVDDFNYTKHQLDELPDGFAVYSGADHMTRDIVAAGGVGAVSVASHLAGNQISQMISAIKAGDETTAGRIHEGLQPLFNSLFAEPSPMPLKAALTEVWADVGEPRLPLIAASEGATAAVVAAHRAAESL